MIKKWAIPLVTVFATGCASKYPVTFDSYPQGATLVCNGTNWGYTPRTLYYEPEVKEQQYLYLSACSANWASGAKKVYDPVPVQQFQDGVRQTAQRPNVPGFQQDSEFALKVQQMNYQRRQAQAAEQSAYEQQRQNNKTTTCITNYGFTTCH
ncbi:hypothetical protein [Marinobacter sp. NFXS9]|uniref:hypothetical protein n=1 Tax=Marinobacter sp. NFXS9 TaxID=2818433 RepID=UPI0032DF234D